MKEIPPTHYGIGVTRDGRQISIVAHLFEKRGNHLWMTHPRQRLRLADFLRKERAAARLKESRQTLGEWLKGRKHV